jgi:hypothetical protein
MTQMPISKLDREYLDSLKTRSLALIILSQTYNGKSRFVNELLSETLLPESPVINKNDVVRMVRIKVDVHLQFRLKRKLSLFFSDLELSNAWDKFQYKRFI